MKILTRDEFLKIDRPVLFRKCFIEYHGNGNSKIDIPSIDDTFYIKNNAQIIVAPPDPQSDLICSRIDSFHSIDFEDFQSKFNSMLYENQSNPLEVKIYKLDDVLYMHNYYNNDNVSVAFLIYEPSDIQELIGELQTCL